MIRRLAVLLVLAALGWFLYTRLRPRPAVVVGDEADLRPDDERGGFTHPTRGTAPTPDAYRPAANAAPAAPTAAAPQADNATEARATDTTGAIKGNIRPDGEKIYHLPGDPAYARTKAEQIFATVEDAEAAGFRRAGRRAEQV